MPDTDPERRMVGFEETAPDPNELRQKRAEILKRARHLVDQASSEKRDLTPGEAGEVDKALREADLLAQEIEEAERRRNEEAGLSPGGDLLPEQRRQGEPDVRLLTSDGQVVPLLRPGDSIRSAMHSGLPSGIRAEELSIGRLVRGLVTGNWKGAEAERRAMGEGTVALGGAVVPAPLSAQIIDLARNASRVQQAGARTVPMTSQTLGVAKVLQDPTAAWREEHASITESDIQFELVTFTARTLAAMVRVSQELLEDAANVDDIITRGLGQALALEMDRVGLRGSGVAPEPRGIRNTPNVQILDLGADGAPVSYADFSRAVQLVAEANGEARAAIYAPRTAGELDRLVDTTGQPLQPPESFRNLRRFQTNQVPIDLTKGTSNNASEAYVGDFNQVWYGVRTQTIIEASKYAGDAFGKLEVLVRGYLRVDVQVVRPPHLVVIDGIVPAT